MMTLKAPYARMTNRTAQLRLRGCGICVASRESKSQRCCSWSNNCEGAMRRFRWQCALKKNVFAVSCCCASHATHQGTRQLLQCALGMSTCCQTLPFHKKMHSK